MKHGKRKESRKYRRRHGHHSSRKKSHVHSLLMIPPLMSDEEPESESDSAVTSDEGSNVLFHNVLLNDEHIPDESFETILLIPLLEQLNEIEEKDDMFKEISMERNVLEHPFDQDDKRSKIRMISPKRHRNDFNMEKRLKRAKREVDDYNRNHLNLPTNNESLKNHVLLMEIDVAIKANILRKMDDFEKHKHGHDSNKYTNWIKDVLRLPFGKTIPLPIRLSDGAKLIQNYLTDVRERLDKAIAGQQHVKDEIVDYIARLISNPSSRGSILALTGPPGSGKTRLVRRGIADALQRPFHVINLGGMNDVHVLTGHDLTYTGAKYGRFAQILMESQCENPVIYLDELDKVQSGSDKGMEIFRVLTHVLDEEQNRQFYDEYFSSVCINLSRIMFVGSLNDPERVDPILRDRLKLIQVSNLDLATKIDIVKNYMLPELCADVAMTMDEIHISDELVEYVIREKVEKEDGCRKLKHKLETIIQKLNTQRITETGIFSLVDAADDVDDKTVDKGERTIQLTKDLIDEMLVHSSDLNRQQIPLHLYN
jgi:ATP-dependent Lon protease